ncbi:MerR family transcriptional regulator [Actinoplanes sp. NPDC051470]|uniref:MerR family transcriptional regulator n=1 Tax=Actinoplanes sp. NPDC051470 TaxID=3157224 RepID=UPI003433A08C
MPATITIGEFSRLTHLPVKTLHHYHEVGVLVPAEVDPATGYRRYTPEQVAAAHLARRLRDVRMPPAEIRAVLSTAGDDREAGIAAHLDRLHRELTETATAVASLRALMAAGPAPAVVRLRELPALAAVGTSAVIDRTEITAYCAETFPRLFAELSRLHAEPVGPGAALYGPGWFEDGGGRVTAYVPVSGRPTGGPLPDDDRIGLGAVPAGRFAMALHAGAFDDLDLTYGLLGQHALSGGTAADGPIREVYLVTPADTGDPARWRTEIYWPLREENENEGDN